MQISFKDVSYIYQPKTPFEYKALQNLSFTIPSGSFVAVIGHTGSGKSTLLQHLNGLVTPTRGEVEIGEFTIRAEEKNKQLKSLREKVGVVFQYPEHQLFEETVKKDIAFGPTNFGVSSEEIEQRIERIIQSVGLSSDMLERSPFDMSGGQMRRVAIAGVLAMEPRVLVLDEPTAGLDPRGQQEMMDMFHTLHRDQQLTTVLVTHSMEDALAYADYVLVMEQGELYMHGEPLEVFRQKQALNDVGLDVPEIIEFITKFEAKFHTTLDYKNQSLSHFAEQIKASLRGGGSS